jgi:hypothetical protein
LVYQVGYNAVGPFVPTDALAATGSDVLVGGVEAGDLATRYGNFVSLTDFGAIGDGITDCTAAWQEAVVYAATNHKSLFVPDGEYIVNSKAVVDGILNPFKHVRIFGLSRSTGTAAQQLPSTAGAVIRTNGGGALEVWFRIFSNESITVEGVVFVDSAVYSVPKVYAATPAIKIKKGDTSPSGSPRYITNNNFSDIAVVGYQDPIVFQGMYPKEPPYTYEANFIGPTHFHRYYPYMCGSGLVFSNCTPNRFRMSESLLFDLNSGGIVLRKDGDLPVGTGTGGVIMGAFDMVHFEAVAGCFRIPSGLPELIGTGVVSELTLSDVTREFCGIWGINTLSGIAEGDPFGMLSPVNIVFSGRVDPNIAFGEDRPINIPANSVVSSQSLIKLRLSDGFRTTKILTPETVNSIDETFALPIGGTVSKAIVIPDGSGVSFNANIEVILSGGALGTLSVKTYGQTGGAKTRNTTGTTILPVTLTDGQPENMITISVQNDSGFTSDVRIKMNNTSCIQTFLESI